MYSYNQMYSLLGLAYIFVYYIELRERYNNNGTTRLLFFMYEFEFFAIFKDFKFLTHMLVRYYDLI